MRIPIRVKDGFPLDPEAPRTQLALRYTAEGSTDRNDMQILQSSFSSPMGGDPLEGEGIRFTCIIELAVGAGELKLQSTDPNVQPFLDYRYLEEEWDRARLREGVKICLGLLDHESYQEFVEECISPTAGRLGFGRGAGQLAAAKRHDDAAHFRHLQDGAGVGPYGGG